MIKLPTQLFTMRSIEGTAVTLDSVKATGFEFDGFFGAKHFRGRKLAAFPRRRDLRATGSHAELADVTDDIGMAFENAQVLNIASLSVPSALIPQDDMAAEGWRDFEKRLAFLSDKLFPHGTVLGYHNHHRDLHVKDGNESNLDLVFEAAGAAPVQACETGKSGGGKQSQMEKR
jgi:hypothetical protein